MYTKIELKVFNEHRISETRFPNCDLLTITENSQSVPTELQYRVMHVSTETAQHAGKFHMLNQSSQIHSVFNV